MPKISTPTRTSPIASPTLPSKKYRGRKGNYDDVNDFGYWALGRDNEMDMGRNVAASERASEQKTGFSEAFVCGTKKIGMGDETEFARRHVGLTRQTGRYTDINTTDPVVSLDIYPTSLLPIHCTAC